MSETAEHGFGESAGDLRNGGTARGEHPLKLVAVTLIVNGQPRTVTVEPRLTLLDALREKLALTGTKKACDRGECGACTVHVEGRRVLSCMMLVAMQQGKNITTIEELE